MNDPKPRLLCLVGPTASGKTALSVHLAKHLSGEIVSCDSMQIYRSMDIGTAKPDACERDGILHHLIDIADPDTDFSVADYVTAARPLIADIVARGKTPILCGGTGLYLDALLRGEFEETTSDPALRERLFSEAERLGSHEMHERLAKVDPESAGDIHENNLKRVLRALEIYESTGRTKSEWDRLSREQESPYEALVFSLCYPDRSILYGRIDRRAEKMLESGLEAEARSLLESGIFEKNRTAAQAIGYKELFPYLLGKEPLDASVERLKIATRHYAKRQMTWFSARPYVTPLLATDEDGSPRTVQSLADEVIAKWGSFL